MEDRDYLILTIDTSQPVELEHFVGQLVGFGHQFEKYIRSAHPDLAAEAKFFVQDVRHGSFIVEILPILQPLFQHVEHVQILDTFLSTWVRRVHTYFKKGGRDETANKSDLLDVMKVMKAISRDPKGKASLDYVAHEDGKRETKTIFKFNTADAQRAEEELEQHIYELEAKEAAQHERVAMVFSRADKEGATIGKHSGERVIIESLSTKARPIIYASQLAEQRVKHELRSATTNLFKIVFIVDVNVELRNGKPWAYRVMHIHQVILDDDDEQGDD